MEYSQNDPLQLSVLSAGPLREVSNPLAKMSQANIMLDEL
jgi:hypothetical protein